MSAERTSAVRRDRKRERLQLLSTVTADQAVMLLAAPYEDPAPIPKKAVKRDFDELLERGLVEVEPTSQRRYRSTAAGEDLRAAFITELVAVKVPTLWAPSSPFSKRARLAAEKRRREELSPEEAIAGMDRVMGAREPPGGRIR